MAGGEPSSEQHGGRLLLPQRAVRSAGGSGGASSGGSGAGHRGHLPQPGGTDSGNELQIRSVSLVYGVQSVRHETARPGGQAAAGADTGSLAGDRGAADLCSVQDPDGRKHHPADAGGLSGLDSQHHLHSAPAGTDGKRPAASGKKAGKARNLEKERRTNDF